MFFFAENKNAYHLAMQQNVYYLGNRGTTSVGKVVQKVKKTLHSAVSLITDYPIYVKGCRNAVTACDMLDTPLPQSHHRVVVPTSSVSRAPATGAPAGTAGDTHVVRPVRSLPAEEPGIDSRTPGGPDDLRGEASQLARKYPGHIFH